MNNKRERINIADGGKVFALAIFIPAVVSVILPFIMYVSPSFLADETVRYWVGVFLSQFLLLASSVGYCVYGKVNIVKATRLDRKIKWWHAALAIVLAFALLCFNLPIQSAVTNFLAGLGLDMSAASAMPSLDNAGAVILAVILVAVMPAFAEEIIYRGFICNALSSGDRKISAKAVLISAAIFAVMHQSPVQTIHPFILGCVMATVYLATGSLWTSVILHFVNNFIVIILSAVAPGFETFVVANWWWIMLIAAAVIAPVMYLFVKNAVSKSDDEIMPITVEERNKSLPYFVAALFFCLFMWVFVLLS